VVVLHSVSDRGLMRPLVGASDSHPKVVKRAWFAVYTISRHEKFVQAQLTAKQIQSFLPLYKVERRWRNGVRREIQYPLFPGYVFVCLGAGEVLPVLQTSGVVYIVGNGRAPLPLDDQEMCALRVGVQRGSVMPHPFLCAGDKVCITRGPFQGVRGYVEQDSGNLALVVTIRLIHSSFAIRVQSGDLELAG
jgi:transcription termination/antitermination protein NusG